MDLIDELREAANVREFSARRYNSKVKLREMQKVDLVLKKLVIPARQGKLQSNWEKPYHIYQKLPHGAYKLQELE